MKTRRPRSQRGYALILILFFLALVVAATLKIELDIKTQAHREREREMIWRGQQYARGIGLFQHKTGRLPKDMDELVKGMPGIHFLRKEYKDPFNSSDGSWRPIYVDATGHVTGSYTKQFVGVIGPQPVQQNRNALGQTGGSSQFVSPTSLVNSAQNGATSSATNTAQPATPASVPDSSSASSDPSNPNSSSTNAGAAAATNSASSSTAAGLSAAAADNTPGSDPPAPAQISSAPLYGAFLIGVGSKDKGAAVFLYKKARNHELFEFLWDPASGLQEGLHPIPDWKPGDPDDLGPGVKPKPITY